MTSMQLVPVLAVAVGGALGAALRYVMSSQVNLWMGGSFPWGTLSVNVLGSLLFGLFSALALKYSWMGDSFRLLILTGGMGALTTFSTFSDESLTLLQQGKLELLGINILSNVIVCLFAVWLGLQLGNRL